MAVDDLKKTIAALMERNDRISGGIHSINNEQARAKARLEHLEKEIPLLLAGEFLGEVPAEKVAEIRREIAGLRELLERAPVTIRGFQMMRDDVVSRHARALNTLRRAQAEQSYDEKLRELEATGYSRDLEGDLRQLGAQLGRMKELEPILQDALTKARRKPIGTDRGGAAATT